MSILSLLPIGAAARIGIEAVRQVGENFAQFLNVEPTETESKEELDGFVEALIKIRAEAEENAELVKQAPHNTPVRRLDDVKAARELDLVWSAG